MQYSAKEQFTQQGFVMRPSFLDGEELAILRQQVTRFITNTVPGLPSEHVFYEDIADTNTLKQIQRMDQHDEWFARLGNKSKVRRFAADLLGGPVRLRNLQYFDKPPIANEATPPHQDGHYFMITPCEAVTIWLGLDHADKTNGCIIYVRGSHHLEMRHHAATKTLGFSRGITNYPTAFDSQHEVACPSAPGDLIAHHAKTIHRANKNKTRDRHRRALGFIYYSDQAIEDQDAHEQYQQALANRLRSDGRIGSN
jgi:phytanoyl-CoA hydroxylase